MYIIKYNTLMNWYDFYKARVNSTYQDYFNVRYAPFIRFILKTNPKAILELGCGIGSISKALLPHNVTCLGYDIDSKMIDLAIENTGNDNYFQASILTHEKPEDILGISHGVLEHFSDQEIKDIISANPNSVHYVPLDKYTTQAYGDERLLPFEHWLELVKPKEYILFNESHDLAFRV